MKKVVIIISIILVALLLLLGGWALFRQLTTEDAPSDAFDTDTPSPFFPLGSGGSGDPINPSEGDVDASGFVNTGRIGRFHLLHQNPIAGATFRTDIVGTTSVRFIEKETGHIFETFIESSVVNRLTNTTIPHIQEVLWGNNASSTVIRYVDEDGDTIKTFIGNIELDQDGAGDLIGTFLDDNIDHITVSPDTESLLYLRTEGSGSEAMFYSFDSQEIERGLSTPLEEIRSQWAANTTILITTAAARDVLGYTYRTNTSGTVFSEVLGPVRGLVTKSNNTFSHILFSRNNELFIHTISNNISATLGLQTIPDKCVWSTQSPTTAYCAVPRTIRSTAFPDEWYQGLVATDDVIWKIDASSGDSVVIFDPVDEGVSLDIDELDINNIDSHLLLRDRHTNGLYLLRVEQ